MKVFSSFLLLKKLVTYLLVNQIHYLLIILAEDRNPALSSQRQACLHVATDSDIWMKSVLMGK